MTASERPVVLLTGASGYVGGRLRKALETAGVRLRCLARRPDYLRSRVAAETEVVRGDVLEPASLATALQDVSTAYYLGHSKGKTARARATSQPRHRRQACVASFTWAVSVIAAPDSRRISEAVTRWAMCSVIQAFR